MDDSKSLAEIAKQLKRIADSMERQQKADLLTGGVEKIKEAIKTRKDELLSNIKSKRDS
jgi:hypothetical protein